MLLHSLNNAIAAGNAVNPTAPLNRDLVGWWLAQPSGGKGNTWIDLCQRNHGTLTSGPTWTSAMDRPGGRAALSFDGTNDYVIINTPLVTAAPLTLSCWCRPAAVTDIDCLIAITDTASTTRYFGLFIRGDLVGDPAAAITSSNSGNSEADSSAPVIAETWQLLTAVFHSDSSREIFINGISYGTDSVSVTPNQLDVTSFGQIRRSSTFREYTGLLDDIRIYQRALSAGEVFQLYQASIGGYPRELNHVRRFWPVAEIEQAPSTTLGAVPWKFPRVLDAGNPVHPAAPLNRGLSNWWKILQAGQFHSGSQLRDLCGKKHGTLTGGPEFASRHDRPGGQGSLKFDGTDDYVDFGTDTHFNPASNIATVSCWFKAATEPGGFAGILGWGDLTATWNDSWGLYWSGGGATMTANFFWGDWSANHAFKLSVPWANWNHFIGTVDGTTVRLYVNGIEGTSDTLGAVGSGDGAAFHIGRLSTNSFNVDGWIDDVRYYNGRCLNDAEVAELYQDSRLGCPRTLNRQNRLTGLSFDGAAATVPCRLVGPRFSLAGLGGLV